jgi:bifunctional UDP-N-acetylglucosamine pyrophosphorylase/glucosamine-1-phosphate N-acetyltransferase
MAGGKGKRMKSNIPKFLHKINEKEMIVYILEEINKLQPNHVYLILAPEYFDVCSFLWKMFSFPMTFVCQEHSLGTGHAIQTFMTNVKLLKNSKILILNADMPFIQYSIINNFIKKVGNHNGIIGAHLQNPFGYGRIFKNNQQIIIKEEKDCTQKNYNFCNMGIYIFNSDDLNKNIFKLSNDNQSGEFYITQIFDFLSHVEIFELESSDIKYFKGVNTQSELLELTNIMS